MFGMDGLIGQLAETPQVKDAIKNLEDIRNATIASLKRFDERLNNIETRDSLILEIVTRIDTKLTQQNDVCIPAGDDGLHTLTLVNPQHVTSNDLVYNGG